jgi:hypothetical protein
MCGAAGVFDHHDADSVDRAELIRVRDQIVARGRGMRIGIRRTIVGLWAATLSIIHLWSCANGSAGLAQIPGSRGELSHSKPHVNDRGRELSSVQIILQFVKHLACAE